MKRDIRIDIMRTIGILLIVLAHIDPPQVIFHMRTFDVPLMSMLIGMSFVLSNLKHKKTLKYSEYIFKRFNRLVIPAWVFVTFYFIGFILSELIFDIEFPYTIITVAMSYFLIPGIGYVWIIRVFFVIAILSPFILKISQKANTIFQKMCIVIFLLTIQLILNVISTNLEGTVQLLFDELIAISFGYIILTLIGMWIINQSIIENWILVIFSLSSFIVIGMSNSFLPVNDFKYPPTPYFLLYGLSISLLLFIFLSNNKVQKILGNNFTLWTSKYSLEIYYWHVLPLTYINYTLPELHFLLKLLLIVLVTYLMTALQTRFFPGFFNFNFKIKV